MLELILRLIRAILASLYMLFEGMPALESLRSWFGGHGGPGGGTTALLVLAAASVLLGVLAFLFTIWFLRRRPAEAGALPPSRAAEQRAQERAGEGGGP